jgi:hypothetical protein
MRVAIENHGTIWLVRPLDPATSDWLRETAPEDAQFLGDALAIEPRYVPNFIDVLEAAGGVAEA